MKLAGKLFLYFKKHWIIYGLSFIYLTVLALNAYGFPIWLPKCPITYVTGNECVGCGMNRALIALLRLDIEIALHYNPLIFLYVPLVLGWLGYDFYKYSIKFGQSKP